MTTVTKYKTLNIQRTDVCHYDLEGETIFMKVLTLPDGMNTQQAEDLYTYLIMEKEKKKFKKLAYLNV